MLVPHDKISFSQSEGTNTDICRSTIEKPNEETVSAGYPNIERGSDNSIEDMCRICHGGDTFCQELGDLISACSCRGTVGRVHVRCLERWLTESGKSRCELCGIRYVTRRVHRYGVPRSLVMWILSQNAKQLMVDTLGIVLMSPLAILAAWLSGKTFAALISQENHTSPAPWPLASTFVLACMTLVSLLLLLDSIGDDPPHSELVDLVPGAVRSEATTQPR
ncbi:E3 ubiquitin-protein ligase MARCH3 [Papilio xuthus]|uniref:E3 ubiquitin-protein ligase MARCH3 n=1 Tax=Papilio xuthus TaxID=66420 RepID=A0A194QE49_PAPXU|nr:E3 ubiquitin-protein ligase MARCH3 [Papilio xuthus]